MSEQLGSKQETRKAFINGLKIVETVTANSELAEGFDASTAHFLETDASSEHIWYLERGDALPAFVADNTLSTQQKLAIAAQNFVSKSVYGVSLPGRSLTIRRFDANNPQSAIETIAFQDNSLWRGTPPVDVFAYQEQFGETRGVLSFEKRAELTQKLAALTTKQFISPLNLLDYPVHEDVYGERVEV